MGAGISQKDLNKRLYTRLKNFQRQLARAGIGSDYKNMLVTGECGLGEFGIKYVNPIRASNGECATAAIMWIGDEWFGGFWNSKNPRFEVGFAKLLEAGKRPAVPVDLVPV